MRPTMLLQIPALLLTAQVLLGAVAHVLMPVAPAWLVLPVPLLWAWLIVRIATVMREEVQKGKGSPLSVWRLPLGAALIWHVPMLGVLAPGGWGPQLLLGAWDPLTRTAGLIWPGVESGTVWVWTFTAVQLLLFLGIAIHPEGSRSLVDRSAAVPSDSAAAISGLGSEAVGGTAVTASAADGAKSQGVPVQGSLSDQWAMARRLKDVRRERAAARVRT